LFTASRFAWFRVWEYFSSIFADIHPAMAFIVDSGTPASPKAEMKVWRRSCSRHNTPNGLLQGYRLVTVR
jgi:hypothetical protein